MDKDIKQQYEREKNKFLTELNDKILIKHRNYEPMFSTPIGPWFKWFAWRPVYTIDRGYRWLRFVYKRPCQVKSHLYPYTSAQWWQHVVRKD